MRKDEILEMNALMKALEEDVEEMAAFNQKLEEITAKKEKLVQFYTEKWMDYYENSEEFNGDNLEILNQDSLWNALSECDFQIREIIKNSAKIL